MKKQNESLVRVLFRETKVNFLNLICYHLLYKVYLFISYYFVDL